MGIREVNTLFKRFRTDAAGHLYAYEAPTGREIHPSQPLANLALKAFQGIDQYIATALLPAVTVEHETDQYYVIDPDSWLLIPNTRRARKTAPARIEFRVASDSYAVKGYALAGELAKEDLANADRAIRLRENMTGIVVEALQRDFEDRVARLVTSGSNLGSYVSLSGANKWSDFVNSDPISDVSTAHAFVENLIGLHPNTLVLDKDTYRIVRRHPVILDMFRYTEGGMATDQQLKAVFEVEQILIARGIKNNALEGATASVTNIWGNNAILAYVDRQPVSLEAKTFGLQFVWEPEGFPAPMQVLSYDDPDPGKATEVVQAQYFGDEKIVAKNLAYGILSTL